MSTFDGIVPEFPDIRIDYFRGFGDRPPLACFLSHVHSDHLSGLEGLRSPFVYCSAATREILLRLETYQCRVNHAQGILEARVQTYKSLAKILKPIPLDTPTMIELSPGRTIRVTLLDANHCVGAVMFLLESDTSAVLYTGDLRCEEWFCSSLKRNPCVLEYTTGLKTLDRIYLDTSMVALGKIQLDSKAEGLRQLIKEVQRYPEDTIFCMQAWTYGYEEVWVALAKALNSKIHVDKYKMGIYQSLVRKPDGRADNSIYLTRDAPYLVGFNLGNTRQEGVLTTDENVRIHSCEKGTPCATMATKPIVWIRPIVAQNHDEVGAGGGWDDLAPAQQQVPLAILGELMKLGKPTFDEPAGVKELFELIQQATTGQNKASVNVDLPSLAEYLQEDFEATINSLALKLRPSVLEHNAEEVLSTSSGLPKTILFPYARHSSLPELQNFVRVFRPRDVWPCTVHPNEWRKEKITMRKMFGDSVDHSGEFPHDILLERQPEGQETECLQTSQANDSQMSAQALRFGDFSPVMPPQSPSQVPPSGGYRPASPIMISSPSQSTSSVRIGPFSPRGEKRSYDSAFENITTAGDGGSIDGREVPTCHHAQKQPRASSDAVVQSAPLLARRVVGRNQTDDDCESSEEEEEEEEDPPDLQQDSQASTLSAFAYETRLRAYQAAERIMLDDNGGGGSDLLSLISTKNPHHQDSSERHLGSSS